MAGFIAIVEDEPELQALYRLMLAAKGYDVAYVSASANDAVDRYARCEKKPDLVIMDRRLDGSSGMDAARRILDMHPGARILFATAEADGDIPRGRPGIVGALQKPFSMEAMFLSIESALADGGGNLLRKASSYT